MCVICPIGAIPVAELCSLKIDKFCVSWPAGVTKVTNESATHTGQSHHDVGGHSVFEFKRARKWGEHLLHEICSMDILH